MLLFAALPLLSQNDLLPRKPLRIGITGGYALNRHAADFLNNDLLQLFRFQGSEGKFPDNFREGLGNGLFAGVLAQIPLDDAFSLSFRASASQHDASLTTKEVYPTRVGTGGGVDTASYSLHTLKTVLPSVGVEALLAYNVAGTGFSIQAGFRGAFLISPQFRYEEQFVSTLSGGNGVFLGTNSALRLPLGDAALTIPQISPFQMHLLGGIGYDIMLGEKIQIRPELHYAFALTNAFQSRTNTQPGVNSPNESNSWNLHQVRGGVAITLPMPEAPIAPPVQMPDTAKVPPTLIIAAFGLDTENAPQGREQELERVTLNVQQTISRSVFPLLPYVFFDGVGSVVLPERYAVLKSEETSAFRESKLSAAYNLEPKEHSYYHVLNIIGERLRRLPEANLTIHGCTDGITAEREKSNVAKARAQALVRYLKDVWEIEPKRLKLQETPLQPNTPSVPLTEAEKQAENRRVELRSDTPALLEHITILDTTRRVTPPSLRFRLKAEYAAKLPSNHDSVRSWRLIVRQAGRFVKEFSGEGAMPESVDWRLDERELALLRLEETNAGSSVSGVASLEFVLSAASVAGKMLSGNEGTIPLETRIDSRPTSTKGNTAQTTFAGKRIERFNLILFDFAKSAMTAAQEPMMNLMKSRITPRSVVRVDGFTDRTGDAEFNRKLSLQRAQGVAQVLGLGEELLKTNVTGYGSSVELYDNNLPEGRFYSRTVRVVVETPQGE